MPSQSQFRLLGQRRFLPFYLTQFSGAFNDNLFKNALEATLNGTKATVKAAALDQALQVTITNTGVGIPNAIRGQIFEPFFTTKAQGTGLGLAIARQLVEHHGGRISVDSDGSTWTSFEVDLPTTSRQQEALSYQPSAISCTASWVEYLEPHG